MRSSQRNLRKAWRGFGYLSREANPWGRKPRKLNIVRDFMKEAHRLGLSRVITTVVLPDGSMKAEMRIGDREVQITEPKPDMNEWDNIQ
jgi:hypothetical protein